MRWDGQELKAEDEAALPGLARMMGLVRSVRTPEFAGITFHEVAARSMLNRVPAASSMPFRWTVNPFRGCSHACTYCYARATHRYLDLDTGQAELADRAYEPVWQSIRWDAIVIPGVAAHVATTA